VAVATPADEIDVAAAERILRDGALAIVPTDTVYGIACAAYRRDACERLYAIKERPPSQPTALVLGSVDNLLRHVLPEVLGRAGVIARRVLPGPVTLVVPNPGRRFAYLCGDTPDRIGVRVPVLPAPVAALFDLVGGLAATSATPRGAPAPARLEDVDGDLAAGCALVVDGGPLPGTSSAVVDVVRREPRVVRDGPGAADVLAIVAELPGPLAAGGR
jgi:L-threonylcarbamoyladenylate synthase